MNPLVRLQEQYKLVVKSIIEYTLLINEDPQYKNKTFVYENCKRQYSITFWKQNPPYNEIHYYRQRILAYYYEYNESNTGEDEYVYIQECGILGLATHTVSSEKMTLDCCIRKFTTNITLQQINNFLSLDLVENKNLKIYLPLPIQQLIRCIFCNKIKSINDNNLCKNSFNYYYKMLRTTINVLDNQNPTFQMIDRYLQSGNSNTDYKIVIKNVFFIDRHGEDENYTKNLHNKKLLWHGTRMPNVAPILSKGLKVAPPNASQTGSRLGKGIYFTNSSSKAASFCGAGWKEKRTEGILLLCEVALGTMIRCYEAQNMFPLPNGFNSAWGTGYLVPDNTIKGFISNDVEIPFGPLIKVQLDRKTQFRFDEFVVNYFNQVRIRYLLHVNFEYEDDDDHDDEDEDDEDDDGDKVEAKDEKDED